MLFASYYSYWQRASVSFPFSPSFCFLYLLVTEWINLSTGLILFASLDGIGWADGVGRPLVSFCLLIYFGCTKSVVGIGFFPLSLYTRHFLGKAFRVFHPIS